MEDLMCHMCANVMTEDLRDHPEIGSIEIVGCTILGRGKHQEFCEKFKTDVDDGVKCAMSLLDCVGVELNYIKGRTDKTDVDTFESAERATALLLEAIKECKKGLGYVSK